MALALGSSASSLRVGSGTPSRMYRGSTAFWDADAAAYIRAVEAADGQALELGVCNAYHNFFLELKATSGLFSAIKASCILCGARTITGALVPLAGTAPTAQGGWASGDYSRTAGMTGDGNALYLDSNRANNADPQNDQHVAVWMSTLPTVTSAVAGSRVGNSEVGGSQLIYTTSPVLAFRIHTQDGTDASFNSPESGFFGATRGEAGATVGRNGGSELTGTGTSESPNSENIHVFRRSGNVGNVPTDATIAFYSIGSDIGSAGIGALDTAVSNLITAIGNAL